jgi:hypothetical protein
MREDFLKNPYCCNPQAQDNEPIFDHALPKARRLEPVIPIALVVAAEGRLSTSTIRD